MTDDGAPTSGSQGGVRELRLALTVDDLDAAVAAYRNALGMQVTDSWDHPSGRGVVLDAGRATLELLEPGHAAFVDEVEVGRPAPSRVRVALHVDESDAAAARLAAAGFEPMAASSVTPWNQRNLRLSTPEGVQLTLFSDLD